MIQSFANQATKDIFDGRSSKKARTLLPVELQDKAVERLEVLDNAPTMYSIQNTPGFALKKLSGEREGQFSIRINDQYRICFYWHRNDAYHVEITDYH
ncbi:MAG: type II toxin-antitoxin system RelE/ParE family toxin [bacterium]